LYILVLAVMLHSVLVNVVWFHVY